MCPSAGARGALLSQVAALVQVTGQGAALGSRACSPVLPSGCLSSLAAALKAPAASGHSLFETEQVLPGAVVFNVNTVSSKSGPRGAWGILGHTYPRRPHTRLGITTSVAEKESLQVSHSVSWARVAPERTRQGVSNTQAVGSPQSCQGPRLCLAGAQCRAPLSPVLGLARGKQSREACK